MPQKIKAKTAAKAAAVYDKNSIRQLKGLEAVREKIGMYLGDPSNGDALHRLIWEVVDNAVDEHLAGHCTSIEIELGTNRRCRVLDNGRGIPVGLHPTEGIDTLELVMCSLHAGGKFSGVGYEESAGLHGIGVSAVNAVSSQLEVSVWRDGHLWSQLYQQGKPLHPVVDRGELPKELRGHTGTQIEWFSDLEIFSDITEYDRNVVANRLQELAFLNPKLQITLKDTRDKPWEHTWCYDHGIPEYLEQLIKKRKPITPVLQFIDGMKTVTLAMAWTETEGEDVRCYANNTFNADGGTHLTGFRNGLTRVITAYAKEHGLSKDLKEGLSGGDIRDGLTAVLSLRMTQLSFSSQTKEKLVTAKARPAVEDLFKDQVETWLTKNPAVAGRIATRAVLNAKAREAAKRARDDVMRKDYTDRLDLPGKLADCQSKHPEDCELFIVEGSSAGGTCKGARDRRFQAVLPLRGKVLNVEKATTEALAENEEISTIITTLGCGIEQNRSFDQTKLRYHKVVICTDADIDGAHIRTLLLTFFYRSMPRLIFSGHVFIALPPLYGVRFTGTEPEFYFSDATAFQAWKNTLTELQLKKLKAQRYKGLGEMNPEQLWVTTLDPEGRVLRPVTIQDAIQAEMAFDVLMGSSVEQRREWIETNAEYAGDLDI